MDGQKKVCEKPDKAVSSQHVRSLGDDKCCSNEGGNVRRSDQQESEKFSTA